MTKIRRITRLLESTISMRLALKKNSLKKCLRHPDASNACLKLTWNQSFRGVRLSPRAAYMQI